MNDAGAANGVESAGMVASGAALVIDDARSTGVPGGSAVGVAAAPALSPDVERNGRRMMGGGRLEEPPPFEAEAAAAAADS